MIALVIVEWLHPNGTVTRERFEDVSGCKVEDDVVMVIQASGQTTMIPLLRVLRVVTETGEE